MSFRFNAHEKKIVFKLDNKVKYLRKNARIKANKCEELKVPQQGKVQKKRTGCKYARTRKNTLIDTFIISTATGE